MEQYNAAIGPVEDLLHILGVPKNDVLAIVVDPGEGHISLTTIDPYSREITVRQFEYQP